MTSSKENAVTVLTDLVTPVPNLSSSPAINVPEVSLKVIVVLFPPEETAKPVAPLLKPSTKHVVGSSVFDTALLIKSWV